MIFLLPYHLNVALVKDLSDQFGSVYHGQCLISNTFIRETKKRIQNINVSSKEKDNEFMRSKEMYKFERDKNG